MEIDPRSFSHGAPRAYPSNPRDGIGLLAGQLILAALDGGVPWQEVTARTGIDARIVQARASVFKRARSEPVAKRIFSEHVTGAYSDPDNWAPCWERASMCVDLPAVAMSAVDREYDRMDAALYGD